MNSTFSKALNATPESKNVLEMLNGLKPKLEQVVERFRKATPTPEGAWAFEMELEASCREHCRALVESEYNDIEPAAIEDCPVRIRLAGEEYKRRPKHPNKIGTLFGLIQLNRYWYESLEAGEPGISPLEMQLGIEAGLATPALTERIGLQAVDHTQAHVLEWLEQDHGTKWSTTSLRTLLASLSSGLSAFRQPAQEKKILKLLRKAEKSRGPHNPVLVVGRDGIMLPMREGGHQEGSTATISVLDRRGKRLGTVYLGQMPKSGQGILSDQLTSLLNGVLAKWNGCPLRYVYVTDAGFHPQEYYETVLKRMADQRRPGRFVPWEWIVDFWHACSYLTKLREALFGDLAAGWKWFKRMRHWLRHRKHGITHVLRSASQHWNLVEDPDAARIKQYWEGYLYLRKYARRMAYSRYHSQGKPIGSGVTEAACKTVFTQRLKQSGMTWTVEGGQVIVDLRVLKLSGVWQDAFRSYQRSRQMPQPEQTGSRMRSTPTKLKKAA
jgi:hypothetical protein